MEKFNIAIDGPAGSGKSTIAISLAKIFGFIYIDTGAMYRAAAWKALKENTDFSDEEALLKITEKLKMEIQPDLEHPVGYRVFVDGTEITGELTSPEVSLKVSLLAKVSPIRRILVGQQRRMAESGGVVMTGRDIGTVVLSDAPVKVFLTASAEERARRRFLQMEDEGRAVDPALAKESVKVRDKIDSSREDSPLKPAEDAVIIDTTSMTIDEVANKILEIIGSRRKAGEF
ncbi:MAG: (d)CMP kinase [Actinobacteria bacterium]|nr:(d)CMP kinase [Actinomycetota bacterium]